MELKWFGEHRKFIEKLILFGNSYARTYKIACPRTEGFDLSASEMQVIEYLLENEENHQNMQEISKRLGISASSFTNLVFKLTKLGILEKYHLENNRKAVIVLVSPLGRKIYDDYAKEAYEHWISQVSEMLKEVPREYVDIFTEVLDYSSKAAMYPVNRKKSVKPEEEVKPRLMPMEEKEP